MISQHVMTAVALQAISIADARTAVFFHLNDATNPLDFPVGMSIPVPAGSDGFTLAYYTRRTPPLYDFNLKYFVDSTANINAGLNSQETQASGHFHGGFFVNGALRQGGPGYLYEPNASEPPWALVVLRTPPGLVHDDGLVYFNMLAGDTNARNSPTGIDLAYVCVYARSLSNAEIAAPLLPGDYTQRYTAAGYSATDLSLNEELSGGLPALFYFP